MKKLAQKNQVMYGGLTLPHPLEKLTTETESAFWKKRHNKELIWRKMR